MVIPSQHDDVIPDLIGDPEKQKLDSRLRGNDEFVSSRVLVLDNTSVRLPIIDIDMKKEHHLKNAKAIIALLILAIAFVIFYKFTSNQDALTNDPVALQDYVIYAIVGGGFLIGLLYLTSNTTHKESSKAKVVKTSKTSKKKKK
jgi:hypothetical protein